jgi:hypothetical protein|tara:strand:- start:2948 stop:3109 length:162 start_codon:yes stop_codon:yes gene_type:complete
MVRIQIDLDNEENKVAVIYKALNGFRTKELAIKDLIRTYGKRIGLCKKTKEEK